jgi:hypothetical protein
MCAAVLAATGCATIPDGCYHNAYSGMESCYQAGEITSQRELTDLERSAAIQQEQLRLQYQQAQSAAMMQMFYGLQMMQPRQYQGSYFDFGTGNMGTFNLWEY